MKSSPGQRGLPRERGSHGIKDWQRDESEASDLYYGLSRFDYTAAITVLP